MGKKDMSDEKEKTLDEIRDFLFPVPDGPINFSLHKMRLKHRMFDRRIAFDAGVKASESRQTKKDEATKVFTDAVSDHVKELYKEGSADFDSVEKALTAYEESLK